jgi:hypothetical protein
MYIGNHAHTATVALGIREFFDIGLGVAGTYFLESYEGIKEDGYAFHFGMLACVPPERFTFLWRENDLYRYILSPRFGMAWRNLGPDVTYQNSDYPLNDSRHWGGAIDMGVQLNSAHDIFLILGLSPAIEYFSTKNDSYYRYGVEATLYDAVIYRQGYFDYSDVIGYNTWGISIKARELVRMVIDLFFLGAIYRHEPVIKLLPGRMNITLDFARKSSTVSDDDIDYYSLTLSL